MRETPWNVPWTNALKFDITWWQVGSAASPPSGVKGCLLETRPAGEPGPVPRQPSAITHESNVDVRLGELGVRPGAAVKHRPQAQLARPGGGAAALRCGDHGLLAAAPAAHVRARPHVKVVQLDGAAKRLEDTEVCHDFADTMPPGNPLP